MMCYHVNAELRLGKCFQAMPLEAISEEDWLLTMFIWLNDVTDLRQNAFATSASSDKTSFLSYFSI